MATFNSFHQGMGAFEMIPRFGKGYRIHLSQPAGITKIYALPKVAASGFALGVKHLNSKKIRLKIHTPAVAPVYVVTQRGGKVLFSQKVTSVQPNSVLDVSVAKVSGRSTPVLPCSTSIKPPRQNGSYL